MADMERVRERVHVIVREGFTHEFGKAGLPLRADEEWKKVRDTGTRLWLDTGDMDEAAKHYTCEFETLTTNNTLLNKEVQKGLYDGVVVEAARQIREVAPDIGDGELLLELAFVLNGYHGLRLVEEFDCLVNVELHTDLADDVERSVAYGHRLHAICPERFVVKVPLTAAGFLAARGLGALNVPVTFTLGFSARQNYAAALLAQPEFTTLFLGRLGVFLSDNRLGTGENVGEKAALAAQRELRALRAAGRTRAELIAASMRSGAQVVALAGLDVFTMPPKAAGEYRVNPASDLCSQVESDPEVALAEGVMLDDFSGGTLWDVPSTFKSCVEAIVADDLGRMTQDALRGRFEDAGFGDFLPRWSADDWQMAATDGKIPVFTKWQERLASGEIGLDALMSLSAFCSFATDQRAFDARVLSLI